MDHREFDALAKGLASQGSRRSMLRRLAGVALGTIAGLGASRSGAFERALQTADSEEQSVMLYEELARIADEHTGSCTELKATLHQFGQEHAELLENHRVEQSAWSREKLVEHADTYGDRRQEASVHLLAAMSRCRFHVSTGPHNVDTATPAASLPLVVDRFTNFQASPVADATPVVAPPTQVATPIDASGSQTAATPVVPGADQCTGTRQVLCNNMKAQQSSPVASVPATCDPTGCVPCVGNGYCTTTYPDLCPTEDDCVLAYEDPSSQCFKTKTMECANPPDWTSETFTIAAYVDSSNMWQSCDQPNYCSTYYPENCPTADTCILEEFVVPDETCCEQNCPISSADCALNWAGGIGSGDDCLVCMTAWCGSTDYCMQHCEDSACCDSACSSEYTPPPPAGP